MDESNDRYGEVYTHFTAADITELHRALVQLADDNRKLDEDAKKLRELSENVEAAGEEGTFAANLRCTIVWLPKITVTSSILPRSR